MTTIGNRTQIVTLPPAAPVVTITGPIAAYGSAALYGQTTLEAAVFAPAGAAFTITSQSSVVSIGTAEAGIGILLAAAGSVLNTGFLSGGDGVAILNLGTAVPANVQNGGTIMGLGTVNYGTGLDSGVAFGVGVLALVAGGVENTGTIDGNNAGILFRATPATVTNGGVIASSAGYGVLLEGGGTLTNSGSVYGYLQGVFMGTSPASAAGDGIAARVVNNAGSIGAGASGYAGYGLVSDAIEVIGAGSVTNFAGATVTDEGGNGVFLFAMGTAGAGPLAAGVTNAGLIQALYGVEFYGAGSVANTGSIIGQNFGVEIFDAGGTGYNAGLIEAAGSMNAGGTPAGFLLVRDSVLTNASGGVIAAPGGNAVWLEQGGAVYNAGAIDGGLAGILGGGTYASFTLQNSGSVTGDSYGIYLTGTAVVSNSGFIGATGQNPASSTAHYFSTGLFLTGAAAALSNAATGTIFSQTNYAVELMAAGDGPQPATLTNDGLLQGLGGVQFFGLGGIANAGSILAGGGDGIVLHYNGPGVLAGSVTNTGLIQSSLTAVYANGPAVVMNGKGGVIDGLTGYGVRLAGGSVSSYLANSGYIGGHVAAEVTGGGTVVNDGTLVGGRVGVAILGGGTLIDGGVIRGGAGGAVYFQPGCKNTLVLDPGAQIEGKVKLSSGTLDLAGTATEGKVALNSIGGFLALTITSGAEWELKGKTSLAKYIPVVNDGTIRQAGGDTLTIAGPLSGYGTIELVKMPVVLNGPVGKHQVIGFTGSGDTLSLGAPQSFHGILEDFRLGDAIDLTSIALSAITGLSFANGVLTLTETTGSLDLTFASPVSFGTETFGLAAAAAGVDVTLSKAGPAAVALPVATASSLLPVLTL